MDNSVLEKIKTSALFDLEKTAARALLAECVFPWEALEKLKRFIIELGGTLSEEEYHRPEQHVWISKSAAIAGSAFIGGPCIICEGAEIRHCAFIRGSALIGRGAVVGNSTEVKNSIIFDGCQIPHFNYAGDSVLGCKAHMGAGSVTSNVKSDKTLVEIPAGDGRIATGLKKFGAMIGDNVEIGCNCVLNPGTIIGRGSTVYPLSSVRGIVGEGCIYKSRDSIVTKI